jgi:hypothetical protein
LENIFSGNKKKKKEWSEEQGNATKQQTIGSSDYRKLLTTNTNKQI